MPKRSHQDTHDEEFARFLAQKGTEHASLYLQKPEAATTLFRNPECATVWWFWQEYDNTEAHRQNLKGRVERARKDLDDLKRKLAAAEERQPAAAGGIEASMRCAKGHPLVDDGSGDLCRVCYHFDVKIVKQCQQCNNKVSVCAKCIELLGPNEDMGLHLFMAAKGSAYTTYRINLLRQKEGRDAIEAEDDLRAIARLREEFYDTEQHRVDLREQANEAEATLLAIEAKLAEAESSSRDVK